MQHVNAILRQYLSRPQKGTDMENIQTYYNAEGAVLLELDGAALELTRSEAEQLFVNLGHVLQDMDVEQYDENGELEECPTS